MTTPCKMTVSAMVLLGVLSVGCSQSSDPVESEPVAYTQREHRIDVQVAPATRQSITTSQEFTGDLLPRRLTRVASDVSGIVSDIPQVGEAFNVTAGGKSYSERLGLIYGHRVQKGDLLLQIDPRDYQVEVQIAEAKLAKATADLNKLLSWERSEEVNRLTALRSEAVARFEQAKRNRDRLKELLPRHAISQTEFEESEMQTQTAAAVVESTTAMLEQAQAGPTPEELAVQRALVAEAEAEVEQKKIDLSKTTIVAPYDGVVTAINVEVGERVAAGGDSLVELMDLRYLVAEINIPEAYVGAIQVKDIAEVQAAGTTEPVPGVVVAINAMVDPATRTFRARVAIDNMESRFKAGQFAKVTLPLRSTSSTSLTIPARALVFIEGQPHVYIVEEGRAVAKRIEPGLSTADTLEVLTGLAPGEQVITDDPSLLSNGVPVSVVTPEARVAMATARQ